ncbi:MAG TPA: 4'-phosphopantetheinyl transferase superfamily protein [Planctomycetota bacterium]|nr:4'-phosphopantetheinyl transferase superfamily protein [Planctomycetota bacterium]
MSGNLRGSFCGDWPELTQDTQRTHPLVDPLVVAIDLMQVTVRPELLDERERTRGARLRTPELQSTYLAAHTALRQVLGWYLARDPATLRFTIDAHGKPRLDDSAVRFNLSHASAAALVAVGTADHLGVDLEYLDRLRDGEQLAERMLAPVELVAFHALPAAERDVALLRTWTRKEAVLKALGVGLPGGMEHVVIAQQPLRLMGDLGVFPQLAELRLNDLPVSAGYAAALCQGSRQQAPTLRRWHAKHVHC